MSNNKKTNKNYNKANVLNEVIAEDNVAAKLDLNDVTADVKIDDSTLIKVKSNTFGELIYINSRTQETTVWSMCGEVQTMTMGDLRAMKANQIAFFENQWIVILGVEDNSTCKAKPADIYKILGIGKYYKNLVEPSDFNEICGWDESEMEERVSFLSDGAKNNLIVALNEYVEKGILDSVKKIKAFEKALNCELTVKD